MIVLLRLHQLLRGREEGRGRLVGFRHQKILSLTHCSERIERLLVAGPAVLLVVEPTGWRLGPWLEKVRHFVVLEERLLGSRLRLRLGLLIQPHLVVFVIGPAAH